jgi:hypothetical protein
MVVATSQGCSQQRDSQHLPAEHVASFLLRPAPQGRVRSLRSVAVVRSGWIEISVPIRRQCVTTSHGHDAVRANQPNPGGNSVTAIRHATVMFEARERGLCRGLRPCGTGGVYREPENYDCRNCWSNAH